MPTNKQKQAFVKVLKGSTISQAMLDVGYSETTASTTGKLTNTLGWQELLEEFLPDSDLVEVHKQGLKATRIHTSHTEPDKVIPDFAVRHKYLETGYKVKGKIKDESQGDTKIMILRLNV